MSGAPARPAPAATAAPGGRGVPVRRERRPGGEEPGHGERLLSIGAAAAQAGVTERALRYYQEIGLLAPAAHTKGGMRRYSQADLARVARIRELQTLLGFNLDEVAGVLRSEDRTAQIRAAYFDAGTPDEERRRLLEESRGLAAELRSTVEAKREALDAFLSDLDARIAKIDAALAGGR